MARSTLQSGANLSINMTTVSLMHPDPWYGVKKCLSVLHVYNPGINDTSSAQSIRTFVACDADGAYILVPGPVSDSLRTTEITRQGPTATNFSIVSVVWGAREIRDLVVYEKLFNAWKKGQPLALNNNLFGSDTFANNAKSAVIWYTVDEFKSFQSTSGREGTKITF
jgi:hypothetical protein